MAAKLDNVNSFLTSIGAQRVDHNVIWDGWELGNLEIGVYHNEHPINKLKPITCSHYTVSVKGDLPYKTQFFHSVIKFKKALR